MRIVVERYADGASKGLHFTQVTKASIPHPLSHVLKLKVSWDAFGFQAFVILVISLSIDLFMFMLLSSFVTVLIQRCRALYIICDSYLTSSDWREHFQAKVYCCSIYFLPSFHLSFFSECLPSFTTEKEL